MDLSLLPRVRNSATEIQSIRFLLIFIFAHGSQKSNLLDIQISIDDESW